MLRKGGLLRFLCSISAHENRSGDTRARFLCLQQLSSIFGALDTPAKPNRDVPRNALLCSYYTPVRNMKASIFLENPNKPTLAIAQLNTIFGSAWFDKGTSRVARSVVRERNAGRPNYGPNYGINPIELQKSDEPKPHTGPL